MGEGFKYKRGKHLDKILECEKSSNEILEIIYAVQDKVWEPRKRLPEDDGVPEEEEKVGFLVPQNKQTTATGKPQEEEEWFMTRWMKYVSELCSFILFCQITGESVKPEQAISVKAFKEQKINMIEQMESAGF